MYAALFRTLANHVLIPCLLFSLTPDLTSSQVLLSSGLPDAPSPYQMQVNQSAHHTRTCTLYSVRGSYPMHGSKDSHGSLGRRRNFQRALARVLVEVV